MVLGGAVLTGAAVGTAHGQADDDDDRSDEQADDEADAEDEDEAREVDAVVGELVEGDHFSIVVEEVERDADLGEFHEPDPDNEFVRVQLALKNESTEFRTVSRLLQLRLRDDDDYQYDQTFAGDLDATFDDGQFAPGELERGNVAFEVPDVADGLSVVFDLDVDIFGDVERVEVDLEESTDVHELEPDLDVEVADVGETVEHGDVSVTVDDVRTEGELDAFTDPDQDHEFVVVDVEIENQTGAEQRISTGLQMLLKDGDGWTYQEDFGASVALDRDFDATSPLTDGESRRGELAYQVAESVETLYWVFEFDLFDAGDKTFWQIRPSE